MTTTAPKILSSDDYKVADLSLAEFGRKEIRLAEHEMPGLMALRAEFGDAQPLQDRTRARRRRHRAAEVAGIPRVPRPACRVATVLCGRSRRSADAPQRPPPEVIEEELSWTTRLLT